MRQILVWGALCWMSCAQAQTASVPEEGNLAGAEAAQPGFLDALRAHRQSWQQHGLTDYVFVLDQHASSRPRVEFRLRVVVKGGRVASASSLDYSGTPDVTTVPTIDALFDRAEQAAPASYAAGAREPNATFDPRDGHIVALQVLVKAGEQDDASFQVPCFDASSTGCQPVMLTQDQCVNAGGTHIATGEDATCGGGWSIGLISAREVCCRTYSEGVVDAMGAARCRAVGGVERPCASNELLVGTNGETHTTCCRRFVE
jgi:hypothetical protein